MSTCTCTDFGWGWAKFVMFAKKQHNSDDGAADLVKNTSICGTPEYMAPETIKELPQTKMVGGWLLGSRSDE